jgi:hypothetical protein
LFESVGIGSQFCGAPLPPEVPVREVPDIVFGVVVVEDDVLRVGFIV